MCQASPLSYPHASLQPGIKKSGEFVFLLSGELLDILDPTPKNADDSADEQGNRGRFAAESAIAGGPARPLLSPNAARLSGSTHVKRGRPAFSSTDAPLVRDIAGRIRKREFTTVSDAVEHAFAQERSRFAGAGTEENLKARVRKKVGKELRNWTILD
jgi:hypothetical protein